MNSLQIHKLTVPNLSSTRFLRTEPFVDALQAAFWHLTEPELRFYQEHQPWYFILFARNIDSREQVLRLID